MPGPLVAGYRRALGVAEPLQVGDLLGGSLLRNPESGGQAADGRLVLQQPLDDVPVRGLHSVVPLLAQSGHEQDSVICRRSQR